MFQTLMKMTATASLGFGHGNLSDVKQKINKVPSVTCTSRKSSCEHIPLDCNKIYFGLREAAVRCWCWLTCYMFTQSSNLKEYRPLRVLLMIHGDVFPSNLPNPSDLCRVKGILFLCNSPMAQNSRLCLHWYCNDIYVHFLPLNIISWFGGYFTHRGI